MPLTLPTLEPRIERAVKRPSRKLPVSGRASDRVWLPVAMVAAAFTLAVTMGMLAGYRRESAEDPMGTSELLIAREKLHVSPNDEALKRRIRELDLAVRQRYFNRLQRNQWGAWMLLLGGGVFVVAASRFMTARQGMPSPARLMTRRPGIDRDLDWGRRAVGTAGIVVIAAMSAVALTRAVRLPGAGQKPDEAIAPSPTAVTSTGPSIAEFRANWARFRGSDGSGATDSTNTLLTWNGTTGENIAWKTSVPLGGFNSPLVWGDRVFLTGSNGRARELFCFDSGNGSLLWRLAITLISDDAAAAMEIPKDTGLAPSTAATDGHRVFAIFATGELIAADFSGRLIWSKNLGKPENPFGHATSLLTWRDRLIVQLDQGEAEAGKSRLYAFDATSGKVVWQQRRNTSSSWATPITIDAGGREQIITLGEPWLISYSPVEGRELWRFEGLGSDLAPSPVFTGELVIVPSPNHALYAIRPDGQGDVTKTHLAWSATRGIPDITSPVGYGELIFTLETSGVLTCFDARTGAMVWDQALKGDFHASPTIAGDHLYLISTDGDVFVVRAGREFQEISRAGFGEPVNASPAMVNDRIFVRGATHLFCVAAIASERKTGADAP